MLEALLAQGSLTRSSLGGHQVIELVRRVRRDSTREQMHFDLREDIDRRELNQAKVEALVHAAYDFRPTRFEEIREINYRGSVRLFDAFNEAGGSRAVFISSIAAYERCRSLYGQVKLETEKETLSRGYWVLRAGLVRGNEPGGIVGTMLRLVKKLPVVPIIGYGSKCLYAISAEEVSRIVGYMIERRPESVESAVVLAAHDHAFSLDDLVRDLTRDFHLKRRWLLPVPWQSAWLGSALWNLLASRSACSDSVLSMMNPDPSPPFVDLERFLHDS